MSSRHATSFREVFFHASKQVLKSINWMLPKSLKRFYIEYRKEYPLVDRSEVVSYTDDDLFQEYNPRHSLTTDNKKTSLTVKVALISTVRNEASNAREWLQSLLIQERRPDEVIITDGGSTDKTPDVIREMAATFPIPIKVIEAPGANIARGRNIAIQNAAHPVIACTDFGCVLEPNWLRHIVTPFESDETIQLSAGYYGIFGEGLMKQLCAHFFGIDIKKINPQTFLPSSRSVAMKKTFWSQSGGYPEWLSLAGEDTLFDYQAKGQLSRWAFVPEARVLWHGPNTLIKLFKTYFRYSVGDGEACTSSQLYWYKTVELIWRTGIRTSIFLVMLLAFLIIGPVWGLAILTIWLISELLMIAQKSLPMSAKFGKRFFPYALLDEIVGTLQVAGYLKGVLNRPNLVKRQIAIYERQLASILEQHADRKGLIVYPPTHDWGFMFQRPHQVARAFAHQDYLYFYCTQNERTDAVHGFRQVEPGLYLSHVPMETYKILKKPFVNIGSAWNRKDLSNFNDPYVIYDHYDDLEVSGSSLEDHYSLLEKASLVVVTNRRLLMNVQKYRPDAILVPNGVDYNYVQQNRPKLGDEPPKDWLPVEKERNPIVGYSGALAEWVDYELLCKLAEERPDWEHVLIGVDYDGSLKRSHILDLPNIHWLGMKSYSELFRYIWRFDVGIIPFKLIPITLSTSPIKLFEYMACKKPVVTTALPDCRNIPGALVAENSEHFLQLMDLALKKLTDDNYLDLIDRVARQHTWDRQVNQVIAAMRRQI